MTKGKENKPHIGIFGRRNNGKSSLINALTNQEVAIVSDYAGTTTDPVKRSLEIHGIGPCIIIDTAGIDDVGELGLKRVSKTMDILKNIDFALLVIANNEFSEPENKLLKAFQHHEIPFIIVHNKSDIVQLENTLKTELERLQRVIDVSSKEKININELINLIIKEIPESSYVSHSLIGDLVKQGDLVLLITPIDIEAPEGRLILPQVQTIRDGLDNDCTVVVVKEREVDALLKKLQPRPSLVITDSQVFPKADASIPKDIPLTSFSIILARQRGDFDNYLKGTPYINQLKDGDRVLILESCSHHVSCDDIGRMKIPRWLSNFTGKNLEYDVVTGLNNLPLPIQSYSLVIQCGGCVLTRKQIINRLRPAVEAGIPVTNYGMAIAFVHGIYNRAVAPFMKNNENQSNIQYL